MPDSREPDTSTAERGTGARPLVILGAGTFATEVLEAAELSGRRVLGFVVSGEAFRTSGIHEGLPVAVAGDLAWSPAEAECIAGIISTKRQAVIELMAAKGWTFAAVRHPTATVSPRARVAAGSFIAAGTIVSANSRIGMHAIVNRGANIAHDVDLGDFATVGPGAVVAGAVNVARRAWIGVGAVVRDHVSIGEGAVVAAGALVVKPVAPHTLVAGSPATVMRDEVDGF
jgi:sugar O-acyltransferase (sialic acid O-acetyltransferase NeuD family)